MLNQIRIHVAAQHITNVGTKLHPHSRNSIPLLIACTTSTDTEQPHKVNVPRCHMNSLHCFDKSCSFTCMKRMHLHATASQVLPILDDSASYTAMV